MSIVLYDKNKIDLPEFSKYQDRIDFVMDNILGASPYCYYYNPFNNNISCISEREEDRLIDRWIGVKTVGKPDTDDSLKHFIDYLSGYILRADELDVKSARNEYITLSTKDNLTDDEKDKLKEINKYVLYEDINYYDTSRSVVFIQNKKAELSMEKRLYELEGMSGKGYSHKFIQEDIRERIDNCREITKKVLDLSNNICYTINEIVKLEKNIRLNSNKGDVTFSDVDLIISDVKKLKEYKDIVRDERYKIRELVEEYRLNTEMFTAVM